MVEHRPKMINVFYANCFCFCFCCFFFFRSVDKMCTFCVFWRPKKLIIKYHIVNTLSLIIWYFVRECGTFRASNNDKVKRVCVSLDFRSIAAQTHKLCHPMGSERNKFGRLQFNDVNDCNKIWIYSLSREFIVSAGWQSDQKTYLVWLRHVIQSHTHTHCIKRIAIKLVFYFQSYR